MQHDEKLSEAEKLARDLFACEVAEKIDRLDPTLTEWTEFSDPFDF